MAPSSSTVWLVAKLDFSTQRDYLFIDPNPASEPGIGGANASIAMSTNFGIGGFFEMTMAAGQNNASFNIDELRVGSDYASVVPEPASLLALGGGLLLAVGRKKQLKGR